MWRPQSFQLNTVMLGHTTYYNGTIRKYVASFGDMFSDLRVTRGDKEIKVPIAFLPKAKWYVLTTERQVAGNENQPLHQVKLPRIAYNLSGIEYDAARARAKNNAAFEQSGSTTRVQFQPVPYNLKFELSILTSNITDQLQLVEQIVPFFTPNFNLSIRDNPLNATAFSDITLRLENVSINNDVEGLFDEKRVTAAELEFTLKGIIFGPADVGYVIKDSTATTRDLDFQYEEGNRLQKYNVVPNPTDAQKTDPYTYTETITYYDQ